MDFEFEFTDELICPYCKAVNEGAWEMTEEDGLTQCGTCEKHFHFTKHIRVDYSSRCAPCANGDEEHKWRDWIIVNKKRFRECRVCEMREYQRLPPPETPTWDAPDC